MQNMLIPLNYESDEIVILKQCHPELIEGLFQNLRPLHESLFEQELFHLKFGGEITTEGAADTRMLDWKFDRKSCFL